MDVEKLRRVKVLLEEKRKLHARLREVNKELTTAHEDAVLEMGNQGIQNMNLDGATLNVSRTVRPTVKEGWTKEQVVESLKRSGWEEFLKEDFNLSSLGAYLREVTSEDDSFELPEGLEMFEQYEIRMRQGGKNGK